MYIPVRHKRWITLLKACVLCSVVFYARSIIWPEKDILPTLWQYDGFEVDFCSPCDPRNWTLEWFLNSPARTFLNTSMTIGRRKLRGVQHGTGSSGLNQRGICQSSQMGMFVQFLFCYCCPTWLFYCLLLCCFLYSFTLKYHSTSCMSNVLRIYII